MAMAGTSAATLADQLQTLVRCAGRHDLGHIAHHLAQLEGLPRQFESSRFDLGDVQHVVQQPQQGLAGLPAPSTGSRAGDRWQHTAGPVRPCPGCRSSASGSRGSWWPGIGSSPDWPIRPRPCVRLRDTPDRRSIAADSWKFSAFSRAAPASVATKSASRSSSGPNRPRT